MSGETEEFVQLDRTFHDLALDEGEGREPSFSSLNARDTPIRWPDLLREPRVALLSEAGAGKTEEVRQTCRDLRRRGKYAFFLRIEHLAEAFETSFEASFEEGTPEQFADWIASGEEGWLLLDSVDEARLRDPKDFERAINKISGKLRSVLPRVHIVITSRSDAWRPKTDLRLCELKLPWFPASSAPETVQESEPAFTPPPSGSKTRKSPFRLVALDDLAGEQVDRFAKAKGVSDIGAFRKALDRADAWSFTTRPLDLAETVEFWREHGRIGSRLELLRASINKRLEERDQDRADASPISKQQVREGARLVAAASTLTKVSAIRVPDGQNNDRGLDIKQVLTDWDDASCRALLTRPIFDEGIYGTVRFHHRSVREFLTAEWLHTLLIDEGSRVRIENLFFRQQYGIEVVVPTMRPILPWLAILDQRILDRVVRLAPEVLFEGGDPAQLPVATRSKILRASCEQLAQPAHGHSIIESSAVQRFTNPDLADVIRELLEEYVGNDDVTFLLLRMIEQGGIKTLANQAKYLALASRSEHTRVAAIRAMHEVASAEDAVDVRNAFISEQRPLNRSWLSELVEGLGQSNDDLDWLVTSLDRVAPPEQYEFDPLPKSLARYAAAVPPDLLAGLLEGVGKLMSRGPYIERRHCTVSKRYGWLGQIAGQVLARMIKNRDPATLGMAALSTLRKLPFAEDYGKRHFGQVREELPQLVQGWPELNRALFWHGISEERARRQREDGERLTNYRHALNSRSYWAFNESDFDYVVAQIGDRSLTDDRLVALTLAVDIFQQYGRKRAWRDRLKNAAGREPELTLMLDERIKRANRNYSEGRRDEAASRRRSARQLAKAAEKKQKHRDHLQSRIEAIRDLGRSGQVTGEHVYLHEQIRRGESQHTMWTDGNFESLIETYGEEIAEAYRDGAVGYWRQNKPLLRSEGAPPNTIPFESIFGLTGLYIEARETKGWPSALNSAEAEIATRYALQELNGFPTWLPQLQKAFPSQVLDILIKEIRRELATEQSEDNSEGPYALYDVAWYGAWIWDQIAPALLPELRANRVNAKNLGYLLTIVGRSSVDDMTLAAIASRQAHTTRDSVFSPIWFATWVGVAPDAAIPALTARLAEICEPADQTKLALAFIVSLVGGRSQEGHTRHAYRTVEHMRSLYLLMLRYIRQEDDIHREGKGVFSPGLRDDAQDARNALIAFILETPGKDAFIALQEMESAHPNVDSRPWMGFRAKLKATADADIDAWAPSQVREFQRSLVSTPANHRELWYHAIDKLEALKHDLENGDASIASILQPVQQESKFRTFIGGWCRDRAGGRYAVPQEEELADAKRPDLRFLGVGFDAPVPAELKIADNWTGPHLFERLEVQLCGQYLRDRRSSRGIFLLVYLGKKSYWDLPSGGSADTFALLIDKLQRHWDFISRDFPGIEDIRVIGIDLTRRGKSATRTKAVAKARKNRASQVADKPPAKT